jgi:hypothetical protein
MERFGLSMGALCRHADDHISEVLTRARDAAEVAHADDLLEQIRGLQKRTENLYSEVGAVLDRAKATKNPVLTLHSVREASNLNREARGYIELLAELLGKLNRNATVNVLIAPEWLAIRGAILEALTPHPDARLAVVARLKELENRDARG